jgi:hypothetical protein
LQTNWGFEKTFQEKRFGASETAKGGTADQRKSGRAEERNYGN